jgi:hypothetical protein
MQDLDDRIRALSELDRIPLIQALIRIDSQLQPQAGGSGRRAKRGSMERYRAEEARAESDRLGRIIYFLRFRSPATAATAADSLLCEMLAEKLRAKGQWAGEYSV